MSDMRWFHLWLIPLVLMCGCAKMKVQKVPVQCRVNGTDSEIKGFRYYLSRPYVIVKKPILVKQRIELVQRVTADTPTQPQGDEHAVRVLDGPREGQIVRVGASAPRLVNHAGTSRLNDLEARQLRRLVAQSTPPGDPARQVGYHQTPTSDVASTALADTVSSDASTHLTAPARKDFVTSASTVSLTGDIQVVFLPDLDEQYAIHNKNVLAKSAFRLAFADGWKLTDVGAKHDSTTVAIEVLNLIDKAIESAKKVGLAKLERTSQLAKDRGTRETLTTGVTLDGQPLFQLVHSTYIRPGIYRLNKPWEGRGAVPRGEGLLVQLGLDLVEFTHVQEPSTATTLHSDADSADTATRHRDARTNQSVEIRRMPPPTVRRLAPPPPPPGTPEPVPPVLPPRTNSPRSSQLRPHG
jgi:hypothetical protein